MSDLCIAMSVTVVFVGQVSFLIIRYFLSLHHKIGNKELTSFKKIVYGLVFSAFILNYYIIK